MTNNNQRKTKYCEHYLNCDRKEDCFNGDYCPVFKLNDNCRTMKDVEQLRPFEDIMDAIWEGQTL